MCCCTRSATPASARPGWATLAATSRRPTPLTKTPTAATCCAKCGAWRARGWRAVQLDCTVIAERPPLAPHTAAMESNLAADLELDAAQVNVKATTTDGLGLCGREQGIAAMAVALLEAVG